MFRSAILAVLLGCALCAGADAAGGVATIIEGRAVVIRGLVKLDAAEGVRLQADDLVVTGKGTFVRIEYDDGEAVDLGSETSIQFNPPARRKSDRPGLYALSGWVKLIAAKSDAHAASSIGSPQFDLFDVSGAVVTHADAAASAVFVEQGSVRWVDRRAHGATPMMLKSGDFLAVRYDESPSLQGRPAPEFVSALPRQFRDSLPSRLAKFRGREVVARAQGAFSYAEVEPWIDAEAPVRRQFVRLWRAKADDTEFRASLEQGLSRHPEWGPVLYPELYEPKPKPVASAPASSAAAPVAAAAPAGPVASPVLAPAPAGPVASPVLAPVPEAETPSPLH